ncbi:MAG: hypothetical protein IPM91_10395 [Bacteroidetes bacterium]|nr:hypothetical protein [Bacteroidota bacterium]
MDFHKIKLITIAALLSDDILLGMFVLKGGNALELVYELQTGEVSISIFRWRVILNRKSGHVLNGKWIRY